MLIIIIANTYEVSLLHIALLVELKGSYKFFQIRYKFSTFTYNVKFMFADMLASVHVLVCFIVQQCNSCTVQRQKHSK